MDLNSFGSEVIQTLLKVFIIVFRIDILAQVHPFYGREGVLPYGIKTSLVPFTFFAPILYIAP